MGFAKCCGLTLKLGISSKFCQGARAGWVINCSNAWLDRETIPADVLVLSVCEKPGLPPQGLCYVETKSLDGETNLKIKNAMPNTFASVSTLL